jgi:hypothetical protein
MARKNIVRNIVEHEGWKNYDSATQGGVSEWACDNAWDDWTNMDPKYCREYVGDLIQAALTKREQKQIDEEDLERICEELRENSRENLETVLNAITDAHTWAWEIAYTPDDGDIEKAIDDAKGTWWEENRLQDFWDLIVAPLPEGPREWSPRPHWSVAQLFKELDERVVYQRKPGYYDRFIIFEWLNAPVVLAMKNELKKHPEVGSLKNVDQDLNDWADDFMNTFAKALENRMERNEPWQSFDLDPHWKSMLKDKQVLAGAREEILKFLATPAKEEVE